MIIVEEFRSILKDRLLDISDKYRTNSTIRISEKTESSFKCFVSIGRRESFICDLEFLNDVLECFRFCSDYFQLEMNVYEIRNHQILLGWRDRGNGIGFSFVFSKNN
jgi:hypothetical protein